MKRWQLTESGRLLWDFAHNAAIEPLVSLFLLVCKRLTPSASMCLFLAFGTTKMIKTIWQIRSLSTGPRLWFRCCRTSDCRSRAPHDSWIAAKLGIWALAWLSIENWFKSLTWLQTFKGIWINFKFHNYLDLQKFHMFCTCTFGPFWPFPAKTERYRAKLNRVFPNQCQYTAELGLKVSYSLYLNIIASHRLQWLMHCKMHVKLSANLIILVSDHQVETVMWAFCLPPVSRVLCSETFGW